MFPFPPLLFHLVGHRAGLRQGWDRAGPPADQYARVQRDLCPSSQPNSSRDNHGPLLTSHRVSFWVSWAGTCSSLSGSMTVTCRPRLLSSFSSWRFSEEHLHCRKHSAPASAPSPARCLHWIECRLHINSTGSSQGALFVGTARRNSWAVSHTGPDWRAASF